MIYKVCFWSFVAFACLSFVFGIGFAAIRGVQMEGQNPFEVWPESLHPLMRISRVGFPASLFGMVAAVAVGLAWKLREYVK